MIRCVAAGGGERPSTREERRTEANERKTLKNKLKEKRARQARCDGGNQKSATEEPAPSEPESGALCDPFALVAIRGVHTGRIIKIEATEEKSSWSVGRSDDNDISLAGDDEVSSQHAQARGHGCHAAARSG